MPGCEHNRTEFLMRRDGVDYLRCLECGQVFEADDLEQRYGDGEDQPIDSVRAELDLGDGHDE